MFAEGKLHSFAVRNYGPGRKLPDGLRPKGNVSFANFLLPLGLSPPNLWEKRHLWFYVVDWAR